MKRVAILILMALATASCTLPPRDILVAWRNGRLVVDFPWSIWRMVGLQNRSWCIDRVQLYDAEKLLWVLKPAEDSRSSCEEVRMPIALGRAVSGFTSTGSPRLMRETRYGVAVHGIGDGRVTFTLKGPRAKPHNLTDRDKQLPKPVRGIGPDIVKRLESD